MTKKHMTKKHFLFRSTLIVSLVCQVNMSVTSAPAIADGLSSMPGSTPGSTAGSTAATAQLLPEDDFKGELRDLHENLRRIESSLRDLEREAGRRQMVANPLSNNDAVIADPWSAFTPASAAMLMNDSVRPGPYLKCRAAFLNQSLSSIDTSVAAVQLNTKQLTTLKHQLTAGSKKNLSKAAVDLDVMRDAVADFNQKLVALKQLCSADPPDNVLILTAVHTLQQTVDGIDTVGKRLWKVE